MSNSPQSDVAVVFACDRNYAPYAFFAGRQIANAHPERSFDICVFSTDRLEMPKEIEDLGIKYRPIEKGNPFQNELFPTRHGAATYLQLLVPPLVAGEYKRIVCLDCDVFFCGDDINELINLDLQGSVLGAVRDHLQWRRQKKLVREFKLAKKGYSPYFNTGVMLLDVEKYVSESILEACLDLQRSSPAALPRHDQSMLNIVMHGSWTELSPVWNWQYTWASRFFADLLDPKIIHFIGEIKPWNDKTAKLPARFRREYTAFCGKYYGGDRKIVSADAESFCWPPGLAKMFLKHALVAHDMARYLDRFSDSKTTYRIGSAGRTPT